jgi:hydrogenase maturation protease
VRTLVIGCGNLLRGDDAAGSVLVRRMWERGLPDGVRCADGGTGGMDVAFQMRGVPEVILVDACSSGSEPGSLFEVPGHEVENLPPLAGINLHAFRWDHAIAFGHWLLKDDYPENVTAYLIEGERYEIGEGLSPAVDAAVDRLVDLLLARLGARPAEADVSIPRPQPVGVFPFPRSHLLVPPSCDAALRAAALLGDAAAGEAALPRTAADAAGVSLLDRYNAFVLAPSRESLADIEAAGIETFTLLARAAAFAHGLGDELPVPGALEGELRAVVLMTAAAGLFERGDARAARSLLVEATTAAEATAPVFAALLEMQIAESLPAEAARLGIEHLRRAEKLAAAARLPHLRSDIWTRMGALHQGLGADGSRGPLMEAVNCYQKALADGITQDSAPACYGQLQNNLGLAYLCMPTREASDRLRTGIAVQSFRKALEVCDRDRDPDMWASVTMNLASALQYLPSTHPEENLVQAVEAYEQVLEVRTEARDPVAHARVLLNQANALAHLGIFKPAIEKLAKALKLFSWHERGDEAATAKEMLDEIHSHMNEATRLEEPTDRRAAGEPF